MKVMKTAEEDMRLQIVTLDGEASYYEVTQSNYEGDGFNVELNTCGDMAESAQVGHATKDGKDASEQEAEHHPTYDDDGRMSGEEDRSEWNIGEP